MQKTSKLVSANPVMYNGVHRSWVSDKYNKTYYVFEVAFENGDKGQSNSVSQQSKYAIGKEYNYNIETKQGRNGSWNIVSGMKLVEQQSYQRGGGGGSYKMSPEKQLSIIVQVAMISANTALSAYNTDKDFLFSTFLYWMLDKQESKKHDMISVQGISKIVAAEMEKSSKALDLTGIIELLNKKLNQAEYKSWTAAKVLAHLNSMNQSVEKAQDWKENPEAAMPEEPEQSNESPTETEPEEPPPFGI